MADRAVLAPPDRHPADGPGRRPAGHTAIRALALSATGATFLLVAVGALVRATGSGLGCPGWPKCFGRWIPPLSAHAVIEYSHRLTALIDILLIGALAVVAVRRYRRVPRIFVPAAAAVGLVVFQAILGAIVVKGDLAALLVTAHFMTAMVLVGTLVYASVAAFTRDARPRGGRGGLPALATAAAAAAFALLAVGAYVRGEGAGLAFRDWPLMNGRVVPALGHLRPALHFAHRAAAAAVFVLVILVVLRAWRARRVRAAEAALALAAGGLFLAQILVGAANVWSRLAPAAVTAHVALAALIWGALVATAATARAGSRP